MNDSTVSDADLQAMLDKLLDCMGQLDALGAYLAASHLDAAAHTFAKQFDLDRLTSETD